MTEGEERAYEEGRRAALCASLAALLTQLGYADRQESSWILEREAAIAQLRELCEAFGDNDWDETLHLADIIEKHLGRALQDQQETQRRADFEAGVAALEDIGPAVVGWTAEQRDRWLDRFEAAFQTYLAGEEK